MIKNEEDKVWITISRTINLGNYESIKIDAGMSQTIQKGFDPDELLLEVSQSVFEIVVSESNRQKKLIKKKKKIQIERDNDDND
jgi:hypothetical protein